MQLTPVDLCNQAVTLFQEGKKEQANRLITMAIQADPGNHEIAFQYASIKESLGSIPEAISICQQLYDHLDTYNYTELFRIELCWLLGYSYAQLGDWKNAERYLLESLHEPKKFKDSREDFPIEIRLSGG